MIYGMHELGLFGDLRVSGGEGLIQCLMTITVIDALPSGAKLEATEPLTRSDVERLRALCDEALS